MPDYLLNKLILKHCYFHILACEIVDYERVA